jgi:hypothetical protein
VSASTKASSPAWLSEERPSRSWTTPATTSVRHQKRRPLWMAWRLLRPVATSCGCPATCSNGNRNIGCKRSGRFTVLCNSVFLAFQDGAHQWLRTTYRSSTIRWIWICSGLSESRQSIALSSITICSVIEVDSLPFDLCLNRCDVGQESVAYRSRRRRPHFPQPT